MDNRITEVLRLGGAFGGKEIRRLPGGTGGTFASYHLGKPVKPVPFTVTMICT